MAKRLLSIVLVLALSVTMFAFQVSAEETPFTIQLANDPENNAYSSTYSPYTLAGTEVTVSPDVALAGDQEIHWFLNGIEVGTSGLTGEEEKYAENFTFNTVDGTNKVQAKVMSGDTVVATSNEITMDFTPIVKSGSDIFSMKLDQYEAKWYYGSIPSLNDTYVPDPAGSGRNVMKIQREKDQVAPNGTHLRIDQGYPDDFSAAQTGSGIVRIDYSIYVDGSGAPLNLTEMKFSCEATASTNHRWSLYAESYDNADGETVIAGSARNRTASLAHNEWVDVSIVIDNNRKVYDVTIGDDQAITGRSYCSHAGDTSYLQYFCLPVPLLTGDAITCYLKDFSIYKCALPGISISSTSLGNAKAVAGSKVVINTESTFENADVVYYCNGVKYTDNKVVASAGTNTVYAQAIGASGNVLGTSDPITFEAYIDTFESVSKTETVGTFSNPGNGTSISDIGRKYSGDDSIAGATRLYYNSLDVKPEIVSGSFSFMSTFKSNKGELFPTYFKFSADKIQVAKTVASNGITVTEYTDILYDTTKDTYNVKTIYDPLYGSYILLVDDVVYSVIDVSATMGTSSDLTPTNTYFYLDPVMSASSDEGNPNKVTLSNYEEGCSKIPENHSAMEYINNAKLVTSRNEITANDDLTVKFVATKGDYANVLCIATVLEDNGELVSLVTQDVTFGAEASIPVSLKLEKLPSDIADGNYTVNVMLWKATDLTPIVSKIVLPNN